MQRGSSAQPRAGIVTKQKIPLQRVSSPCRGNRMQPGMLSQMWPAATPCFCCGSRNSLFGSCVDPPITLLPPQGSLGKAELGARGNENTCKGQSALVPENRSQRISKHVISTNWCCRLSHCCFCSMGCAFCSVTTGCAGRGWLWCPDPCPGVPWFP